MGLTTFTRSEVHHVHTHARAMTLSLPRAERISRPNGSARK